MIYITGDMHGDIWQMSQRIKKIDFQKNDYLIILGDVCANFYLNKRDKNVKEFLNNIGCTILCIHGNHEERPENIPSYKEKDWHRGKIFIEDEFPNVLFLQDGNIYDIDGQKFLVLGGAYSVDKYYRAYSVAINQEINGLKNKISMDLFKKLCAIASGQKIDDNDKEKIDEWINSLSSKILFWFKSEQPSDASKMICENNLEANNYCVDYVLSHTSPLKYEPREMFLSNINQDIVDKTTEKWLDEIEEKINYKKWYAGHFHTNKIADSKFRFLFEGIDIIDTERSNV